MKMGERSMVRCQKTFNHPVNKVFEAFLDPTLLCKWYGPRFAYVGELFVEPIVGGRFDIELISEKFGSLWTRGFFKEIQPNRKLVYTFIFDPDLTLAGDSVVTVDFVEGDHGTEVTVLQVLEKVIDPTGRTQGWKDLLDKLDELLLAA
ncbi:MAG: SRPBCC domain-containing protein [Bacteroidia bacterium]|nr:SRPBCC domain-containing protein [Bacteroidia bacterium]MBP8074226.1 SRPBCC domain-containing protein [Bacteroidia bacterium]